MGQKETVIRDLCAELGITRQTLYRHVSPDGSLRPDGQKLLGGKARRLDFVMNIAARKSAFSVTYCRPDTSLYSFRKCSSDMSRMGSYMNELR
jgi:hypothetical protein